eukprot:gb/GFBE01050456.1/.p1 GENE.gb/GFBE01050456.1/~~gb/GFBE01050456.1/.p1  ORF type:complete len:159 (+),score=18.84 gb/GFBE01050456.1/:1-477(+)
MVTAVARSDPDSDRSYDRSDAASAESDPVEAPEEWGTDSSWIWSEDASSEELDISSDGGEPRDSSLYLSQGSILHAAGTCTPCTFFRKWNCVNGAECNFCHEDHAGEGLKRGLVKAFMRRSKLEVRSMRAEEHRAVTTEACLFPPGPQQAKYSSTRGP